MTTKLFAEKRAIEEIADAGLKLKALFKFEKAHPELYDDDRIDYFSNLSKYDFLKAFYGDDEKLLNTDNDGWYNVLPPQLFVYCPWSDLPELSRTIDSNRVLWIVYNGNCYWYQRLRKHWNRLEALRDEATRAELSQAEWILDEGLCRSAGEAAKSNAILDFRALWKDEKFKFNELRPPE